jgi:hypothetical protein
MALIAVVGVQLLHSGLALAEQRCRMEKQCHWENYKKICTYVKVCRDH